MTGTTRSIRTTRSTVLGLLALACALLAAGPAGASDPDAWASPIPEQPAAVLVQGATVWTCGPGGRLEGADLLVEHGRISAVGVDLPAPAGALVIDAAGKHVTPGLIDAHSHTAIDGSVNEGTDVVTAEVRVADVLDPTDVHLYWELAGGLTAANVLHGSANAIGGQNAIIKLRWGASPQELLFQGAQPGIKLALGENPKQSNWNTDEERYPQTRLGVEQAIVRAFEEALAYRRAQERAAAAGPGAVPPRPDLRLETLLEILDGKRHVHSHAYRADEMLMLLGLSERYGFTIDAFQHALEGYKIADELAARGVGASTFSDWWAYKYEVVDAIPYNGAILTERGVVTSFNSDSDELARRLNTEAAKAVRYGGLSEEEALKLVTLNPAIQLGVAGRVGTLEPGKDADFVIWSGNPLSTYSLAEETWIDGRRYFDRAEDLSRREEIAAEREALIDEAKGAEAEAVEEPDAERAEEPPDEPGPPAEPEQPEQPEEPPAPQPEVTR
jgi:imidazolonepropionase-like amidohydrolase